MDTLVEWYRHTQATHAHTNDKSALTGSVSTVATRFSMPLPPKIEGGWNAVLWTMTPMQKTQTAVHEAIIPGLVQSSRLFTTNDSVLS